MQRGVLIIAVVLGLGAMASLALRPSATASSSSAAPAVQTGDLFSSVPQDAGNRATSVSGPGDWVMEGGNPARTRTAPAALAPPLTARREVRVIGADEGASPPVIARGLLLAEAKDGLQAIDLASGKQRWSVKQSGSYISPAVAGGRVFVRAEENNKGQVLALDLDSGRQLWAFTPRRISNPQNNFYGGHLTSPVVVDDVVFVGAGKEVYALEAATGKVRWEFAAQDYLTSSATVADGQVYISDFRYFYAIDQERGVLRWSYPIESAFSFSAVASGQTVLLTNGSKLTALDTATGAQRWELSIPNSTLVPAGADSSRAFVKSTETLYALDLATGKELWRYADMDYVSLPALTGSQVFVVSGLGANTAITVLDAASGAKAWKQPVRSLTSTAPVIAGRTLYVRKTDGSVLAFGS